MCPRNTFELRRPLLWNFWSIRQWQSSAVMDISYGNKYTLRSPNACAPSCATLVSTRIFSVWSIGPCVPFEIQDLEFNSHWTLSSRVVSRVVNELIGAIGSVPLLQSYHRPHAVDLHVWHAGSNQLSLSFEAMSPHDGRTEQLSFPPKLLAPLCPKELWSHCFFQEFAALYPTASWKALHRRCVIVGVHKICGATSAVHNDAIIISALVLPAHFRASTTT